MGVAMIEYMDAEQLSHELSSFVRNDSVGLANAVAQRYATEYGTPQGYLVPRPGAVSSCRVTDLGLAILGELTYRTVIDFGDGLRRLSEFGEAFVDLAARFIIQAARNVPISALTAEKAFVLATLLHGCALGESISLDELSINVLRKEAWVGRWPKAFPKNVLVLDGDTESVRLRRYLRLLERDRAIVNDGDGWLPVASGHLGDAMSELLRQQVEGVS